MRQAIWAALGLVLAAVVAPVALTWPAPEPGVRWATVEAQDPRPFVIPVEPDEEIIVACDYSRQVGTGATVSSFTWSVTQRGANDDLDPQGMAEAQSPSGQRAPIKFSPVGRHGGRYQVHVLATLSNGMKLACNYLLDVDEVIIS